eukprot:EG_transcript_34321
MANHQIFFNQNWSWTTKFSLFLRGLLGVNNLDLWGPLPVMEGFSKIFLENNRGIRLAGWETVPAGEKKSAGEVGLDPTKTTKTGKQPIELGWTLAEGLFFWCCWLQAG